MNAAQQYATIQAFYDARGGERSGESDFGVWWTGDKRRLSSTWPRYRVSVAHDTGDVYAFNYLNDSVELLRRLKGECSPQGIKHDATCVYTLADRIFKGWADEQRALSWAYDRLAGAL